MQVAKPKKGYKLVKTSFGKYEEIPEEWELADLKVIFSIKQGKYFDEQLLMIPEIIIPLRDDNTKQVFHIYVIIKIIFLAKVI